MNNELKLYIDEQQDDIKKNTMTKMTKNPDEKMMYV